MMLYRQTRRAGTVRHLVLAVTVVLAGCGQDVAEDPDARAERILCTSQGGTWSPTTETCSGEEAAEPASESVLITYKLDGSATGADITYTDGSGNIQQQTGIAVPLVRESDGEEGINFVGESGMFVQFSAQNAGESGDLDCTIEADGEVINTGHASGGFAIVSCSATVP